LHIPDARRQIQSKKQSSFLDKAERRSREMKSEQAEKLRLDNIAL
jgi:hypothetical protein